MLYAEAMGKKPKAGPPTQDEVDVERFRLLTDVANADAARLRSLADEQHEQLGVMQAGALHAATEREDMYQYLDAQMLQAARDRQVQEAAMSKLRQEADRERTGLQQRLDEQEE